MKAPGLWIIRRTLTRISPELNAKVLQRIKTGRKLDFENPSSLSEKLVVLKIRNYNHNPLVKKCADKYAVRAYVQEKGYGHLLNELIAVYETVDDVEWDKLPEQFAMKWNFGCGYNIICRDKNTLDIPKTISRLIDWLHDKNFYLDYAEFQYKDVPPRLLIEKYLKPANGPLPPDYKLYCFHGKCRAILYIADRDQSVHSGAFFDTDWNYLGVPQCENHVSNYCAFSCLPSKPKSLQIMIDASEALSDGFPFVRCDFYEIDGKAVFGEMTFTPAGGHDAFQIDIHGKRMTDYLTI